MIIPAEIVSEIYPVIEIEKDNLKKIFTGKPIHEEDLIKKVNIQENSIISVFCGERFVGMYKVLQGGEVFAKPEFVLQPINSS